MKLFKLKKKKTNLLKIFSQYSVTNLLKVTMKKRTNIMQYKDFYNVRIEFED